MEDTTHTALRETDLRIEVFRHASGIGLTVPTNDSSVRVTHLPTGLSACATHRSSLQAKAMALTDLRSQISGGELMDTTHTETSYTALYNEIIKRLCELDYDADEARRAADRMMAELGDPHLLES